MADATARERVRDTRGQPWRSDARDGGRHRRRRDEWRAVAAMAVGTVATMGVAAAAAAAMLWRWWRRWWCDDGGGGGRAKPGGRLSGPRCAAPPLPPHPLLSFPPPPPLPPLPLAYSFSPVVPLPSPLSHLPSLAPPPPPWNAFPFECLSRRCGPCDAGRGGREVCTLQRRGFPVDIPAFRQSSRPLTPASVPHLPWLMRRR